MNDRIVDNENVKFIDEDIKNAMDSFFDDLSCNDVNDPGVVRMEVNGEINKNDFVDDAMNSVIELYKSILGREPDISGLNHYANMLKHGVFTVEKIREILMNSDEYKRKRNDNVSSFKVDEQEDYSEKHFNIYVTYCMMGTNRLEEICPYLETAIGHVDKFIFIDGGSSDGTINYLNRLKDMFPGKVEFYIHEWNDMFSAQRNNYLQKLADDDYEGYVLVSDTDEHFKIETLKHLKDVIFEAEKDGYTGIEFQVEDVIVDDNNNNIVLSKNVNNYWKPLLFKFYKNLRYEGEPHETLKGVSIKWMRSKCLYEHIRSQRKIYERAVENFFISNSNRYSDKWSDFRYICSKNNLLNFSDFFKEFKNGSLPEEVEQWILDHKDINEDTGDSEIREMYKLYYEILHPNKLIKLSESDNKHDDEFFEKVLKYFDLLNNRLDKNIDLPDSVKESIKNKLMNILIKLDYDDGNEYINMLKLKERNEKIVTGLEVVRDVMKRNPDLPTFIVSIKTLMKTIQTEEEK